MLGNHAVSKSTLGLRMCHKPKFQVQGLRLEVWRCDILVRELEGVAMVVEPSKITFLM